MEFDERAEREARAARLVQARRRANFRGPKAASDKFGWKINTYKAHESGRNGFGIGDARQYAIAFDVSLKWLNFGVGSPDDDNDDISVIPIMGYLGAGAEVEPDFEQVPPDGLEQYEVPFPLPPGLIGFRVQGVSMLPVYKPDQIIVVFREQKRPLASFFGEEAAVRTTEGQRFIKTIMKGEGDTVSLLSWNAKPIENVLLDWIGEIFATLNPGQIRRIERQRVRLGGSGP